MSQATPQPQGLHQPHLGTDVRRKVGNSAMIQYYKLHENGTNLSSVCGTLAEENVVQKVVREPLVQVLRSPTLPFADSL